METESFSGGAPVFYSGFILGFCHQGDRAFQRNIDIEEMILRPEQFQFRSIDIDIGGCISDVKPQGIPFAFRDSFGDIPYSLRNAR